MTDRYNALTIVLDKDMRSDAAESLINAIKHLRGVSDVIPNVASIEDAIAYSKARSDLGEQLLNIVYPPRK